MLLSLNKQPHCQLGVDHIIQSILHGVAMWVISASLLYKLSKYVDSKVEGHFQLSDVFHTAMNRAQTSQRSEKRRPAV